MCIGKLTVATILLIVVVHGLDIDKNTARYDNYRLYRLHLTTQEHVRIFQEIEERSDSYSFIGHAREVDQKLIVLVAAHKVAECADILRRYSVEHVILVCVRQHVELEIIITYDVCVWNCILFFHRQTISKHKLMLK